MRTGTESGTPATEGTQATSPTTVLRLDGADATSLVHRLSTQTITDLSPRHARPTLFCDFRGRLLHRVLAARTSDGALWLLRDDAPAAELAAYVDRHVFRDQVRIVDRGDEFVARPVAEGFGLAPGTVVETDGVPARVQVDGDFGLELGGHAEPEMDEDELEELRVRAGRPRHGHEIRDEFHPFEVRLAHEVHLSKGCYTGQEVLLRLVTHHATRRRLVLVRGPGVAPAVPCDVMHDEEKAGRLTSTASTEDGWVGLAVLRDSAIEPPVTLIAEAGGPVEIEGVFAETHPLGLP